MERTGPDVPSNVSDPTAARRVLAQQLIDPWLTARSEVPASQAPRGELPEARLLGCVFHATYRDTRAKRLRCRWCAIVNPNSSNKGAWASRAVCLPALPLCNSRLALPSPQFPRGASRAPFPSTSETASTSTTDGSRMVPHSPVTAVPQP